MKWVDWFNWDFVAGLLAGYLLAVSIPLMLSRDVPTIIIGLIILLLAVYIIWKKLMVSAVVEIVTE